MYSFPDCFWFLENSKIYTPVTQTILVFQMLLFILNNFEQEETVISIFMFLSSFPADKQKMVCFHRVKSLRFRGDPGY